MKNRFGNNSTKIKKINDRYTKRIKPPKHIFNLIFNKKLSSLKNKSYKCKFDISNNIDDNYKRKIIIKNINKYNVTKNQLYLNSINNLIDDKSTHEKVFLRDSNIFNDHSEYLKGFYKHKEIIKIFPRFYTYYKNYFEFFLKPTLSDFIFGHLLKKNGDKQAEYFYERYKDKKNMAKNKNKKIDSNNKKILKTNIIEKSNNFSSLNASSEIINDSKSLKNSDFSSISLLSIINLINNKNTSLNKSGKEKDFLQKKINLFLDLRKEKNTNNKSQKSTTALTPTNIHNVKIINNYKDNKITKPKIKNELSKNFKNIFKRNNENNDIICLSERKSLEKNYKNNLKNFMASGKINANNKNPIIKEEISNKTNYKNKIYYNMKESSFTPTNFNSYQLTTQMSNNNLNNTSKNNYSNLLSQTQIKKVIKKSPIFRNYSDKMNITSRKKYKNIKYNNINNNGHNNTMKLYFRNRNNFITNSFIYYQKIKSENN